jgi:hypothetical protein
MVFPGCTAGPEPTISSIIINPLAVVTGSADTSSKTQPGTPSTGADSVASGAKMANKPQASKTPIAPSRIFR